MTLTQRRPEHLSRKRAKCLTKDRVEKWMEFVEQVFQKAGLFKLSRKELSRRIWNCDETAFATASCSKSVLARGGPNQSTKQWQEVAESTSLCSGVGMLKGTAFLHTFYTRPNTYTRHGHLMVPLEPCMVYPQVAGCRKQTFIAGLLKVSFLIYRK
jgi:hypothetical protein